MLSCLNVSLFALALGSSGAALAQAASAAEPASAPLTAQQSRMGECNRQAGGMKGDERKAFMSSCLKDPRPAQQRRMADCNKQAGDKKGDERKAFMKQCLSG